MLPPLVIVGRRICGLGRRIGRAVPPAVGAEAGGAAGVAGAAPVVTPGSVLARGVTSRMPGGAAGGDVCAVFCAVEDVPAWLIDELFRP